MRAAEGRRVTAPVPTPSQTAAAREFLETLPYRATQVPSYADCVSAMERLALLLAEREGAVREEEREGRVKNLTVRDGHIEVADPSKPFHYELRREVYESEKVPSLTACKFTKNSESAFTPPTPTTTEAALADMAQAVVDWSRMKGASSTSAALLQFGILAERIGALGRALSAYRAARERGGK